MPSFIAKARFLLFCWWVSIFLFNTFARAIEPPFRGVPGPLQTIVIDPGHGGEDTGAIGPSGVKEKDITLILAKRLEEIISSHLKIKVILTRTDDTFVSLEERTAIANRSKADLFISIHTNAAFRRTASGVETFFLSFEASDDDARRVAAFENGVIALEEAPSGDTDELKAILWDLTQTEFLNESSQLAVMVQANLYKEMGGEDRGVKQAPFLVLMGATMPAILVEVGFITNPDEEKRLTSAIVQDAIANALFRSIAGFEEVLGIKMGYAREQVIGDR
ncbi:MAG: N-acetylmuramoyl-L-alanine amidase [Deltaproteobacteria bacterium]|nr:N-acetylmuramoyl-L-alanine amidase [Deltaproteobacteria bacterium]